MKTPIYKTKKYPFIEISISEGNKRVALLFQGIYTLFHNEVFLL
jgi:hypothetical protein